MASENKAQPAPELPSMTIIEFLQDCPPGRLVALTDGIRNPSGGQYTLYPEALLIYCPNEVCQRYMLHRSAGYEYVYENRANLLFLTFTCQHCRRNEKHFAVLVDSFDSVWRIYKIGEFPRFGPPTPPQAVSLIGEDKDLFFRGRQCENQGLGIGAFAYYRRVIVNQWKRLVDHVLRAARTLDAPSEVIVRLEKAGREDQFRKAVDMAKDALPESLLIKGKNPLTYLYGAISEGIHDLSDAERLGRARCVRVLLFEFAERLATALRENKEVEDALNELAQRGQAKKVGPLPEEPEGHHDSPTTTT